MAKTIPFFRIEELVDPETFNQYGQRCWWFLSEKALASLVALREQFGPLTVNDWVFGGGFKYSGFRHPDCPVGAKLSQHKFGRAFDVKSKNYTAVEMQEYILMHPHQFPHITTMENAEQTLGWLHFDTRPVTTDGNQNGQHEITIFNLK